MTEQRTEPRTADLNQPSREARIIRTATEARQGEIILGRRGIWIWIASFAVIVILFLIATL
jgi:hypothetical protein